MENNREQQLMSLDAMENASENTKANPKVTVDWVKNFGGELSDEGFGVDVDKEGNTYLTGSFEDNVTFGDDITLDNNGKSDAFVAKLNETGEVLWAKNFGGSSFDDAFDIKVDEAGNSYITGRFEGQATFLSEENSDLGSVEREISAENDNQPQEDAPAILIPAETSIILDSKGSKDIFVTKLDSSGKVKWAKNFGSDSNGLDSGEGITVDKLGNIYIAGRFEGTATFGEQNSLTSNGFEDGFVTKLNENGEVVWAKKFGGEDSDIVNAVTVDELGNTYVTGRFAGTVNFDANNSLTSNGQDDIFVSKLKDSGDVEWLHSFGATSNDEGYDIAVDKAGNTYITGSFQGSTTFGDTTLESNGARDGFVAKLDVMGNVKWAKKFGGQSTDKGFGITLDESENIYLTGSFQNEISFGGTTLTSVGDKDTFIAKLDKMGMVKWAKKLGSDSEDEGFDIAVNGDSETYVTGSFEKTAQIDNTPITSEGKSDAFLVKLAEEMPEISLAVSPERLPKMATIH